MARRLKKHETEAVESLWRVHDDLKRHKGTAPARVAIEGVISLLQSDSAPELTGLQYDALPVGAAPMRDPNRKGLIMRHGPTKGMYWLFRTECPESRKQVEIELGIYRPRKGGDVITSLADARAIWEVLDARRKQGFPFTKDGKKLDLSDLVTVGVAANAERMTVGDLAARYLKEYAYALNVNGEQVKRSADMDQYLLDKYILPKHADTPLTQFTAQVIDDLIDEVSHAPRTQQKLYSLLSIMNRVARKKVPTRAKIRITKRWIDRSIPNPMPDVTPPIAPDAKRYASTNDEIRDYIANLHKLGDPWCDLLTLQAQTLCRINEAAALPWSELDLQAGTWTLPAARSKNKRSFIQHLSKQSLDLLTRRREANPDGMWAFPSNRFPTEHVHLNAVNSIVRKNRDALGVSDEFATHAARRRALTWMREQGIAKEVRDACSNHFDGASVDGRYTESANMAEHAANAVQAWCNFLHRLEVENVVSLTG